MGFLRKLRDAVDWVLGADLSEPAAPAPSTREPPSKQAAPVRRTGGGDGFDGVARAPRVALTPSLDSAEAPVPLDEPQLDAPQLDVPPAMDFVASLDDLKDLDDAALEPQPEFIPEGGISTQSLMREFETLDPELQAAATEAASRATAVAVEPAMSTQSLMGEVDSLMTPSAEAPALVAQPDVPSIAPPQASGASAVASSGDSPLLPASAAEVPAGAMVTSDDLSRGLTPSTPAAASSQASEVNVATASDLSQGLTPSTPAAVSSHASEVNVATASDLSQGLTPSTVAAVPSQSEVNVAPASDDLSQGLTPGSPVPAEGASSEPPALPSASTQSERSTPAWLIPATTSAPPPPAPEPTDFNASVDDLDPTKPSE